MYVYVKETCALGWQGGIVRLKRGAVWSAADPFVKANPKFFSSEPVILHSTTGARPVEEMTAEPGQKRRTK